MFSTCDNGAACNRRVDAATKVRHRELVPRSFCLGGTLKHGDTFRVIATALIACAPRSPCLVCRWTAGAWHDARRARSGLDASCNFGGSYGHARAVNAATSSCDLSRRHHFVLLLLWCAVFLYVTNPALSEGATDALGLVRASRAEATTISSMAVCSYYQRNIA